MARWFFLAALAALLLIACAQTVSQPTPTSSPVAALPSSTATVSATLAATDTAVPTGTTPTPAATDTLPPLGTPTVLVTPSPTRGTTSTATPGKTNGPTDHPATTATPKPVTPSPKPATPSPKPATPSPKPATPSPKPATPTPNPTPTKAPTPSPAPTPHWDIAVGKQGSSYTPKNFDGPAGEIVWRWFGRNHSVTIVGGADSGVKDSGTFIRTLGPGTYTYFCTQHGHADGSGMAGTLTLH